MKAHLLHGKCPSDGNCDGKRLGVDDERRRDHQIRLICSVESNTPDSPSEIPSRTGSRIPAICSAFLGALSSGYCKYIAQMLTPDQLQQDSLYGV